jgi:hypothetical protein
MNKRQGKITASDLNRRFVTHLKANVLLALGLLAVSLAIGMAGYHWSAGLGWTDAFLNAAMLLGGMGPVDPLPTDGAKMFAGVYALYCGVVFIATAGLIIAPVGMHVLHKFHLDKSD